MKILSDNKNYEKLDMYYHSQIIAASAFSIGNLELLFSAKFIFKQKAQAKKQLAMPKTARYRKLAKAYVKNNIKMVDILEIAQKSRQKKKVYFDAPIKPQSKKPEQKTI